MQVVNLDRTSETWVGTFPGVGTVSVDPDGSFEVTLDPIDDAESAQNRVRALTHGWAEPMALARRGFRFINGAALCPSPDDSPDSDRCLVLHGDINHVALVLVEMIRRGWSLMSDRITPATVDDGILIAHPHPAPILLSKRLATKYELGGDRARDDTNAVIVDVPRCAAPRRVVAHASVGFRRPKETVLTPLSGHARFNSAAGLMLAGVLAPFDADISVEERARKSMAEQLRFAQLPCADVRLDEDPTGAIDALVQWWTEATTVNEPRNPGVNR